MNSKGLITEQDIGEGVFAKWKELLELLYSQAQELNKKEWSNPTELKECSRHDDIWDTIKLIFNDTIGKVNGLPLQYTTDVVCLIIAYATHGYNPTDAIDLTKEQRFRVKLEHFIARQIIEQRSKTAKILQDELTDKRAVRSLRQRDLVDFKAKSSNGIKIGTGKIDFSKITYEAYEKVCSIAENPHSYKEYIDSYDERLSEAYILFLFGKLDSQSYAEAWACVLHELGIKPTVKGIEFLAKRVDEKIRPYMYEALITQRVISPTAAIHMRFYQDFYKILKEVLDEKQIYKTLEEICDWDEDSVLYIYKGRTSCHTRNHVMEQATAIFTGRNDSDIKLNVEHCKDCGKFYMSYSVYESYREKYGMLLGKIKMDSSSATGIEDIVLSEFSPLRLCGYSVNQQDGYSRAERQYIISKVIEKGILRKSDVIRYLEHFINRNGQKANNALALEKWKEDLDFTLRFRMTEQAEYQIKHIKKY